MVSFNFGAVWMCWVTMCASRQAAPERARVVDRGSTRQREGGVGHLGAHRGRMGCGQADTRACRDRHVTTGERRFPRRPQFVEQERPSGAELALGARHLDLREATLCQRLRRVLRLLAVGEVDQLVERVPSDAQPHRRHAGGEQCEVREHRQRRRHDGSGHARLDRALGRDEGIGHRVVQRARPPHTRRVPRVVECHGRLREPAEPEGAVVAQGAAEDPSAVLRATPPRPPPGHGEAVDPVARRGHTLAVRGEHATGDRRRVTVDLPCRVGREERRHRRRRRSDHRAPARRAVGVGDRGDRLHHRRRIHLGPAVGLRNTHPHQAGVGERLDGRQRETADVFTVVRVRLDQLCEIACGFDDRCGHHVSRL